MHWHLAGDVHMERLDGHVLLHVDDHGGAARGSGLEFVPQDVFVAHFEVLEFSGGRKASHRVVRESGRDYLQLAEGVPGQEKVLSYLLRHERVDLRVLAVCCDCEGDATSEGDRLSVGCHELHPGWDAAHCPR